MARPRKDSGETPTRERIIEAFWELYRHEPIERITVQRVANRARCNRSTFYRHFEDIYDVLSRIEDEVIPHEVPIRILAAVEAEKTVGMLMQVLNENTERLEQISVLLSKNGDPTFSRGLKNSMIDAWVKELGGNPGELDLQTRLLLEFTISGIVGVLSLKGDQEVDLHLDEIAPTLFPLIARQFVPTLKAQIAASL
jgi:AcrR family transcriptional regulator